MMLSQNHFDSAGPRADVMAALDKAIADNPTSPIAQSLAFVRQRIGELTVDHVGASVRAVSHRHPHEPGWTINVAYSAYPDWERVRAADEGPPANLHPIPPMNPAFKG